MVATRDQVVALIASHQERDEERFRSVVLQIAARSARNGHTKVAESIRARIGRPAPDPEMHRTQMRAAPQTTGSVGAGDLAPHRSTGVCLNDMVLPSSLRQRIERTITEQQQRGLLSRHGLAPMSRLLLIGPPGTGKSMTAAGIANALGLTLRVAQLASIVDRFMGSTSSRLRVLFDEIRETRAVFLLDEFDALAAARSSDDVGEARRTLNSLLMFLEEPGAEGIVIAATNHETLLDRAVFRRFDCVLRYEMPSAHDARRVLRNRVSGLRSDVDWDVVAGSISGQEDASSLSHSELVRAAENAMKAAVFSGDGAPLLTTGALIEEIVRSGEASHSS